VTFAQYTVDDFLAAVAAREPAPGGGAVAALTAANAAALTAMAARFSTGDLAELATEADELRAGLTPLADADAYAYSAVLAAYRLPKSEVDRKERIAAALRGAAEVPLRIAEGAARVGELAARLAVDGNPNLLGDARAAAYLAEAATRTAAGLVEINVKLAALPGPWRNDTAAHVQRATTARETAVGGTT